MCTVCHNSRCDDAFQKSACQKRICSDFTPATTYIRILPIMLCLFLFLPKAQSFLHGGRQLTLQHIVTLVLWEIEAVETISFMSVIRTL